MHVGGGRSCMYAVGREALVWRVAGNGEGAFGAAGWTEALEGWMCIAHEGRETMHERRERVVASAVRIQAIIAGVDT